MERIFVGIQTRELIEWLKDFRKNLSVMIERAKELQAATFLNKKEKAELAGLSEAINCEKLIIDTYQEEVNRRLNR